METFMFAAKLKVPYESLEEVKDRIDLVTKDLDLTDQVDIRIGNELIKGISGGQKKRLSIGLEIISEPMFIFLDEPTSGLDSSSAKRVCLILRRLADSHRCIVL